jgi:hypothetical protein
VKNFKFNRFNLYLISYIASAIIFFINILGGFSPTFLFLSYIVSSFTLVFTFEILPEKKLNSPQIHIYRSSRLNNYTYFIGGLFAFAAMIFYVATTIFPISNWIVVLIEWPICWAIAKYIANVTSPTTLSNMTFNFVLMNLGVELNYEQQKITSEFVDALESLIQQDKLNESVDLKMSFVNQFKINPAFLDKVETLVIEYLQAMQERLTSQEVDQVTKS